MAAPTHESQPVLDHLAPASVKRRLTRAALFLMAYELMKGDVEKVKTFYVVGFDDALNLSVSPSAVSTTDVDSPVARRPRELAAQHAPARLRPV